MSHHDHHDHSHSHDGMEHSHPHDHSHGHDHEHAHDGQTHSHPHAHGEGHHHDHGPSGMSFPEKMTKLLEHWIRHNDDHAKTYQNWAGQARQQQMGRVAVLIEEAAAMSLLVNEKFTQAKALIENTSL